MLRYTHSAFLSILIHVTAFLGMSCGRQPFLTVPRYRSGLGPAVANQRVPEPYLIGAWYYPGWSSANDSRQPCESAKIFGHRDPWGGVRQYASGEAPWGWGTGRDYYRSRKPLIGFYDLMDQRVMGTHILQAASHGLSYFAFYWDWDKDKDQETGLSLPIHKFVSSSHRDKMLFLISLNAAIGQRELTMDMWVDRIVPFLINEYITDSSYLRLNGRPVILDFNIGFKDKVLHRQGIDSLRQLVRQKVGEDPLILSLASDPRPGRGLIAAKNQLDVDGFFCFHLPPSRPAEPYQEVLGRYAQLDSVTSRFSGVYVPCASTGQDARPWYKIGWGRRRMEEIHYNSGITPEIFEEHLRRQKQYIDDHPRNTLKMLTIYGWNEWGEGGIIEPSEVYEYRYLDIVQRVFGLTPVAQIPPAPSLSTGPDDKGNRAVSH